MKSVAKKVNMYFFGVESLEGTDGYWYYIVLGGSLALTLALGLLVSLN